MMEEGKDRDQIVGGGHKEAEEQNETNPDRYSLHIDVCKKV